MRIRRSRPAANFTQIPNSTLRDQRLSYLARGVLGELLSRPDQWTTTADELARTARRERGQQGEGRRRLRDAFGELVSAGYMRRGRERDPATGRLSTVLTVTDVPDAGTSVPPAETSICPGGTDVPLTGVPVGGTSLRTRGEEHGEKNTGKDLAPPRTRKTGESTTGRKQPRSSPTPAKDHGSDGGQPQTVTRARETATP